MKKLKSVLIAVGLGATMVASAFAQGTAFTYQGRLNNSTNPANGSYDMAFTLYVTNVTGTAIAGPVTNTAVPVTNGLFTTLVNFTNGFSGGSNWLQVSVSSNGLNAFNALLPRQQLTPVPYAVRAGGVPGLVIQPNADSPNVILGYAGNSVTGGGEGSFIGGGGGNNVDLGLTPNTENGSFAVIDGGYGNTVLGFAGTVGGGYDNSAGPGNVTGAEVVGGGYDNNAGGDASVIAGGEQNTASGDVAAIGGGIDNLASGKGAVIAGGGYDGLAAYGNTASGNASVVGGGMKNNASGNYATVPGGTNNSAAGNFSFAAGQQALALHQGAFVWADSQNAPFASTANNQFLIRAQGGVGIGTTNPLALADIRAATPGRNLVLSGPGSGTFSFYDTTGSGYQWDISGATNAFQISRSGIDYPFTISKATGYIGIATTTPNSQLAVVGNIYFGKQRPNTTFNQIGDTIYLGAEQKYLGNTLQTPVDGSTDWVNLMANPLSAGIILGVSSSSTVNPHSNAVPLMVIKSNGNVGIGGGTATNPATALQVNGTITATSFSGTGAALIGLNGANVSGVALTNVANTFFAQQTFMVNDTDYGCLTTDGTNELGSYIGLGQCSFGTITPHALGFFVNDGYDSMDLNTNGNLGIGTGTPAAKLEVNGNAQIDGPLAANYLRAPGLGINTGTYAFTQRCVATNLLTDGTVIFNPICNGDPNAILIVTHNYSADTNSTSPYNTKPVGVYYTGANWVIYNEDQTGMALGRAFNVMVIKP